MRARAALAAVLALTPVLLAAAAAGVLIQRDELTRATALVAEEQARTVARDLPDTPADPGVTDTVLGGEENPIQVVGADGAVVGASPDLKSLPALLSPRAPASVKRIGSTSWSRTRPTPTSRWPSRCQGTAGTSWRPVA